MNSFEDLSWTWGLSKEDWRWLCWGIRGYC